MTSIMVSLQMDLILKVGLLSIIQWLAVELSKKIHNNNDSKNTRPETHNAILLTNFLFFSLEKAMINIPKNGNSIM